MLQAIRERAKGFFAWVLLLLIGVPFALWGIQNYFSSGSETPVAVVGDRDFFQRDVTRAYEQTLANLPDIANLDEKQVKRQVLDRLIDDELIEQEARGQRLIVADDAVRNVIQSLPYFQTDKVFDKEKYKTMLASQNLSPGQFTEQIRRSLVMDQYHRAITDSALASDWQVKNFYRLKNQRRQIEYVTFPLRKVEPSVSDSAVEEYYQQHRADYLEPETLTIDYVVLTVDDLAAAVKPTAEELRTFYEEQKGAFTTPEERRVSHILIAADAGKPDSEKAALDKARAVHERLVKGEDFAKLAKEVSEDTVSAAKGGDLGVISKGMMDPNFETVALSLPKDGLSDPVRTPFGYHLIKVTELKPSSVKSFEEVKTELAQMYRRNAVDSRFYELGQSLTQISFEHPDSLEPAAKSIDRKVERSQPFSRDKGEGIAAEKVIRDAAFSEDVLNGKNSELLELGPEKVAVIRVYDRRAAFEKPLAEVRKEVVERIRLERAKEQTRAAAEELLKKLETGGSLASLAKAAQLTVSSPPPLQRNAKDLPAPLVEAVFSVSKPGDRPARGMVALDDGSQVVYSVNTVTEQAPANNDPEVGLLKNYLEKGAGQEQFAAWITELRKAKDVYIAPSKD